MKGKGGNDESDRGHTGKTKGQRMAHDSSRGSTGGKVPSSRQTAQWSSSSSSVQRPLKGTGRCSGAHLVQQQESRLQKEGARQRNAHAPTTRKLARLLSLRSSGMAAAAAAAACWPGCRGSTRRQHDAGRQVGGKGRPGSSSSKGGRVCQSTRWHQVRPTCISLSKPRPCRMDAARISTVSLSRASRRSYTSAYGQMGDGER